MVFSAVSHLAAVKWQLCLEPYDSLLGLDIQDGFFTLCHCLDLANTAVTDQASLPLSTLLLHMANFLTTWWSQGCWTSYPVLAFLRVRTPRYPCRHCKAPSILLTKTQKSCPAAFAIFCLSKVSHRSNLDSQGRRWQKSVNTKRSGSLSAIFGASISQMGKDEQYSRRVFKGELFNISLNKSLP